jgi:hypothetical protein
MHSIYWIYINTASNMTVSNFWEKQISKTGWKVDWHDSRENLDSLLQPALMPAPTKKSKAAKECEYAKHGNQVMPSSTQMPCFKWRSTCLIGELLRPLWGGQQLLKPYRPESLLNLDICSIPLLGHLNPWNLHRTSHRAHGVILSISMWLCTFPIRK